MNAKASEHPGGPADVLIIEWRSAGHRLAYVRALVRGVLKNGGVPTLVTTEGMMHSEQFEVHLRPFGPRLNVCSIDGEVSSFGLFRILRSRHNDPRLVVLPEGDRFLALLILARIAHSLPPRLVTIVMRPPSPNRALLARVKGSGKTFLVRLASARPLGIRVLLLEDPLATPDTSIWPEPLRAACELVLDPSNLSGDQARTLPPELATLGQDARVISLVGSITERKRLPLILDAFALVAPHHAVHLVIAGKVDESVRPFLTQRRVSELNRLSIIDRYLDDSELLAVLDRSHATFVLYDGGLSSGVLITAAARGRWVITASSTRTGRVAEHARCGVSSALNPHALAQAVEQCLSMQLPTASRLSTTTTFAATVLQDPTRGSEASSRRLRFPKAGKR